MPDPPCSPLQPAKDRELVCEHDDGQAHDLSIPEQRALGQLLHKRRAAAAKHSLVRRAPIRGGVHRPAAGSGDRREELLAGLEAARRLPAGSAYARHRRSCLEKALALLDCQRCGPSLGVPLVFRVRPWHTRQQRPAASLKV